MGKILKIRNSDGSEAPYDEEKIARSIYLSAKEAGRADMVVARELAGVVTLFLERRHWTTIPEAADVQDMVERVLLETGHVDVAKIFIRERQSLNLDREAAPKPRETTLFPETKIEVMSSAGDVVSMWDRSRIARALSREASLPPDLADSIAGSVEARILSQGVDRISSGLIRSLVDSELFSRGFHDLIRPQAVVGVPGYDLKKWVRESSHPSEIVRRVSERSLSEFSFSEVFSKDVAAAHAAGSLYVVGAQYPVHLHSAFVTLETVKRFGGRPWSPADSAVPEDMAGLREALRETVSTLLGFVHDSVDIGYFNLMAAPLLQDQDPSVWAGPLLGVLENSDHAIPPSIASLEIVGSVPDFLRFTDAVGPGGIRLGRGYGEFWTDAERLTRALIDESPGRPGGPKPALFFHVDQNTFRNPSSLSLLRGLCAETAKGLPVVFAFERQGSDMRLHTRYLTRVDDASMFRTPEGARIPFLQMVAVNAAQAAYRAGRGNMEGFTNELDAALKLAFRAFREKADFLARLADSQQGPFRTLAGAVADGRPFLDFSKGEHLLAVCGFPEAVLFLTGTDLHTGGEALEAASKGATFISLRAREEARKASLRVSLSGPCPEEAAARMHEADLSAWKSQTSEFSPNGYARGLKLAGEDSHDLLQAVRLVGNLRSFIEPCITIETGGALGLEAEGLFDLVCEVFERTEMTYLRFDDQAP